MVGVKTANDEMSSPAPAHPLRQWVRMVGVKTKTDEMSSPAPVSSNRGGPPDNQLPCSRDGLPGQTRPGSTQNHVAANCASQLICRAVPGAACNAFLLLAKCPVNGSLTVEATQGCAQWLVSKSKGAPHMPSAFTRSPLHLRSPNGDPACRCPMRELLSTRKQYGRVCRL